MTGPQGPPDPGVDLAGRTAKAGMGEAVYRELLSRMLSLRIEPGARLSIDSLARELGVSQTPIREALARLEADGAVVRTHLSGYRIAPRMTRVQFEDLVEVRLLLEPAAARHAAERMSPEQVEELRCLCTVMAEPAGEDRAMAYAVFAGLDAQFHDVVAAGGGNAVIRESLARLHTHVRLFRLVFEDRIRADALEEHEAVLAAISARDPDRAAYAMRRHIERSAERFSHYLPD